MWKKKQIEKVSSKVLALEKQKGTQDISLRYSATTNCCRNKETGDKNVFFFLILSP